VLRQAYERPSADSAVLRVFGQALDELRRAGAVIVDPARVDSLDAILARQRAGCNRFKFDLARYFAERGPNAPVKSVDDVLRTRNRFHPTVELRLRNAQAATEPPEQQPGCAQREAARAALRTAVLALMDSLRLDALVYPTWSQVPRLIGDLNTPGGDDNQLFAPSTGFPAITVPMGYTRGERLPAGLQFFGRAWSEPMLLSLAYAYEQATHHRHAPALTPPLR
jgi:Asp-tRNA(Asn)/Glu-tRNA(Gln) amidotransferase A subunit family amidase